MWLDWRPLMLILYRLNQHNGRPIWRKYTEKFEMTEVWIRRWAAWADSWIVWFFAYCVYSKLKDRVASATCALKDSWMSRTTPTLLTGTEATRELLMEIVRFCTGQLTELNAYKMYYKWHSAKSDHLLWCLGISQMNTWVSTIYTVVILQLYSSYIVIIW